MGYKSTCNSGGANTGLPKCRGNYGRGQSFILVPPTAEIDTEANSLLEATWTAKIKADESIRWYPLPKFFRYAPSREDHIYTSGDFNDKYSVKDGDADGIAAYLNAPVCFMKKLREFNNQEWKAYEITDEGYIKAWSTDGIKMLPFDVFFNVEADMDATAEEGRLSQIRIYKKEAYQWNDHGIVINPKDDAIVSWEARSLSGLLDADVTVVTSIATSVVIDVKTDCDLTPVTGLVKDDFILEDDTPSTESITTSTESTTIAGRYTLAMSELGPDNYTINLKEPAAMTTAGYQAGDDGTFVISE